MQLPAENATKEELLTFAAGLGSARRMRLIAALLSPEMHTMVTAENVDEGLEEVMQQVEDLAAGLNEMGALDTDWDGFAAAVYENI